MAETEDRSSTAIGVPEKRRAYVPTKKLDTDYPLIDCDPHFKRVVAYARPSDWAEGGALAVGCPTVIGILNKYSPMFVGKGGNRLAVRLAGAIGLYAGFLAVYTNSSFRFMGLTENRREIDRDMREMVDKVKRGEPLYGVSTLSEHHQAMAHRNSRFSQFAVYLLPFFNLVNHNHHGVDTSKYYRQAERELAAEGK